MLHIHFCRIVITFDVSLVLLNSIYQELTNLTHVKHERLQNEVSATQSCQAAIDQRSPLGAHYPGSALGLEDAAAGGRRLWGFS